VSDKKKTETLTPVKALVEAFKIQKKDKNTNP